MEKNPCFWMKIHKGFFMNKVKVRITCLNKKK